VVEDESALSTLLRYNLEREGYRVFEAKTSGCSRSARPDRTRAAAWVDGNMHAVEVCGSSVALAIAEDVIALHRGENRVICPRTWRSG